MTTLTSERPTECYVWVWLPGAVEPTVAGLLRRDPKRDYYRFGYGRSYLERPDSISLFTPELPLQSGFADPPDQLEMAGCLWDASPDSWGQRVIIARLTGGYGKDLDRTHFGRLTFLLNSGSNRIGGLDFQESATEYVPRLETATLDELHEAASALDAGDLSEHLARALVYGTAVGGARPKVLIAGEGREYIAKFSMSTDRIPMVKGEAACLELARRTGIEVPNSHVVTSLGRDVLLVERFDRPGDGTRRLLISGLTMLGFGDMLGARYSSYPELLDVLRKWGARGSGLGQGIFERVVFNVAIGNIDDHGRNHSAFWDGKHLELTPAYDLAPEIGRRREANQSMDISRSGDRRSRFATCIDAATDYGLSRPEAASIVDRIQGSIRAHWDDVCDMYGLSRAERDALWGTSILNPYCTEM
jgi:serine/threonine-protein kinase HipA